MSNVLVMYNSIFEESLYLYLIIFSVLVRKSHIDILVPISLAAIHKNGKIFVPGFGTGNMHHVYYLLHLNFKSFVIIRRPMQKTSAAIHTG